MYQHNINIYQHVKIQYQHCINTNATCQHSINMLQYVSICIDIIPKLHQAIKMQFQHINMHQHASTCTNMHQHVSIYINMYQHTSTCTNKHRHVPTCINIYQQVSTSINIYKDNINIVSNVISTYANMY